MALDHGLMIEARNRSLCYAQAIECGFIPYTPEIDLGVDFILYRETDDRLFKCQLKSRVTINRKYVGRNIHVVIRDEDRFYIVHHDNELMPLIDETTTYLSSRSWTVGGEYNSRIGAKWRLQLKPYLLGDVLK